ncbi:MAG: hypothetical protein M3Z01_02690 [Thermoproteota archaeon]|nr:hypothetical protein [Thermoproteota archaeon]
MSDKNIIEKAADVVGNITKFRKQSKLKAGYIEQEEFNDSNLHSGYFCYNCIYWVDSLGGKCMIVDEKGPDVFGNISKVIAAHGWCNGYQPNYDKLSNTNKS